MIEQQCRERGQVGETDRETERGQTGGQTGRQTGDRRGDRERDIQGDREGDRQGDRQGDRRGTGSGHTEGQTVGPLASHRSLVSPASADSQPLPCLRGSSPPTLSDHVPPLHRPSLLPLCFVFDFLQSFLCSTQMLCLFTSVKC